MKAKVHVTLKKSVLDPQGKTIHHAVETLGYQGIQDIRQGKYFEIELDRSINRDQAHSMIVRLAREVLSNPVLEDYAVELEDVPVGPEEQRR